MKKYTKKDRIGVENEDVLIDYWMMEEYALPNHLKYKKLFFLIDDDEEYENEDEYDKYEEEYNNIEFFLNEYSLIQERDYIIDDLLDGLEEPKQKIKVNLIRRL